MRTYQVRGTTPSLSQLVEIGERYFAGSTYRRDSEIFVRPDAPIIECVHISQASEGVQLGFETVSHTRVIEEDRDADVIDAVQSKNAFLRDATGRTVADRKQQMREDVVPEGVTFR